MYLHTRGMLHNFQYVAHGFELKSLHFVILDSKKVGILSSFENFI